MCQSFTSCCNNIKAAAAGFIGALSYHMMADIKDANAHLYDDDDVVMPPGLLLAMLIWFYLLIKVLEIFDSGSPLNKEGTKAVVVSASAFGLGCLASAYVQANQGDVPTRSQP